MKRKKIQPILIFLLCYVLWFAWRSFALPQFPEGSGTAILDAGIVKALIWVPSPLLLAGTTPKRGELFQKPFPVLACVILLCCTAVFLHSVRLLNGLLNTHVIFDPMMLFFSVTAGAYEELGFRGGFFRVQEAELGFWPAALSNGLMFTLYHYPELLIGQWQGLISWRAMLIFGMGVVFCWMFKKWRNLALNMTVHTAWDILSYLFCLTG